MRKLLRLMAACLAFSLTHMIQQEVSVRAEDSPPEKTEQAIKDKIKLENFIKDQDLAGFHFGTAISFTHDMSGSPRIKTASVVNGIVRVTEQQNDIPRIMLESHYMFKLEKDTPFCLLVWTGCIASTKEKWGWGPYVAIQPGTDNVIQAVAMGLMLGFKREKDDKLSWNLGLGVSVDPNTKVLGDGITRNAALPTGETEARLRTTSRAGLQIIFSAAF